MAQRLIVLLLSLTLAACTGGSVRGKIVFQSNRDGNFDIYSMEADGTGLKQLTNSPGYDVSPAWSPDGSHIVFASDRQGNWDIYVMRSDGSDVRKLTSPPGSNTAPSWAQGGTRIVFISTRDALNGEIYAMDRDGGRPERITHDSTVKDSPWMTPDGKSLVYTSGSAQGSSVAILNLADRSIVILTPPSGNASDPRISQDGSLVLYAEATGSRGELYTVSVAEKTSKCILAGNDFFRTPAWGSSMDEVIYSRRDGLYLMSITKGKETRLSTKGDSSPDWVKE